MPKVSHPNRFYPLSKQQHFITLLCLVCLGSIFYARVHPLPYILLIPGVVKLSVLITTFIIFTKKPKVARLILLIVSPLFLHLSSSNLIANLSIYQNVFGKEVTLIATVQDDAAYNNYGDYEFNITKVHFAQDGAFMPGRIRVRTKQLISVYRGDKIIVDGKLKPALGSRTGSISYATVETIESEPSWLEKIRLKFFKSIYSALPEPHASLGIGFLAGVRSSIPKDFQDKLSRVGLTHIIAVSGYNLTILVLAISKLGKKLSKYQQLIISLTLIVFFLLITGFSPSVVRAAVVCVISLLCSFFGRKVSALNLILISAALTSAVNPVYLWEDIGWWLSFLAFFGVLILAPAIVSLTYKNKDPGVISSIVIESLSAQIMTAPLISHVFGTLSAISLFANVLVVPWVPAVMLLVSITGALGLILPHISTLFALMPKIVLTPIIFIIDRLAALPWAALQLKISQAELLGVYALILIFIVLTNKKQARGDISETIL